MMAHRYFLWVDIETPTTFYFTYEPEIPTLWRLMDIGTNLRCHVCPLTYWLDWICTL